jgi:uncharacterized protein YegL
MRQYRRQIRETLEGLVYVVKSFDHDGMDLYFTNSSETVHSRNTGSMLAKLDNIAFNGETYMGAALGKALKKSKNKRWSATKIFKRGQSNWSKSIYVLTDGKWYGDDESLCDVPELIARATRDLDSRAVLGIQFIQFGKDRVGTWRLKELDDGLKKHGIM